MKTHTDTYWPISSGYSSGSWSPLSSSDLSTLRRWKPSSNFRTLIDSIWSLLYIPLLPSHSFWASFWSLISYSSSWHRIFYWLFLVGLSTLLCVQSLHRPFDSLLLRRSSLTSYTFPGTTGDLTRRFPVTNRDILVRPVLPSTTHSFNPVVYTCHNRSLNGHFSSFLFPS